MSLSPLVIPSVLWRCWLGGRKDIRPVKNWVVGVAWLSVWSEVQTCIWPSWCRCHSLSLVSVKSILVLPFWYRLTWVVPEKGPLNGCVCVCIYVCVVLTSESWPLPSWWIKTGWMRLVAAFPGLSQYLVLKWCLHFTTSYTTGCKVHTPYMNHTCADGCVQLVGQTVQMSTFKQHLSGPARSFMTRQDGYVDSRRWGTCDRNF